VEIRNLVSRPLTIVGWREVEELRDGWSRKLPTKPYKNRFSEKTTFLQNYDSGHRRVKKLMDIGVSALHIEWT